MYKRILSQKILEERSKYPVLAVMGPRQSGKTTLVKSLFSDYQYILLEDLDTASFARQDPRGFFSRFEGSLILDEVQKAPELLSYIQGIVDEAGNERQFILTGSEHLLLSEKISQTLAGRVRLFTLLPLSQKEHPERSLEQQIFCGGYPRIYDRELEPKGWLSSYYATYVEKDIRTAANISQIDAFDRVIRLCAARTAQLIDYSEIANSAGVSAPTVKSWISALKATFICFILEPHFNNFNKRIVKTPKLFFYDTGLLCHLLRIPSARDLALHPLYGHIFENWVIAEHVKAKYNAGEIPQLYFWRDRSGNEVDLVEDVGGLLKPTEIKSAQTLDSSFFKSIEYLNKLQGTNGGELIYGGKESHPFKEYSVKSWREL